jgi:plastocyanin/mono/diheme cytochrome c family protein
MGRSPLRRTLAGLFAGGALVAALGACGTDSVPQDADLIAGKKAFVKSCGSCHVLNRAGTKGNTGPSLDDAFRVALSEGFGRDTVRGVVHTQILHPARLQKSSKVYMPAKLVDGKLAHDVAAYVASVAALPGKDTGRLGSAVAAPGAGKPIAAKAGKLLVPTDPNGQLAYVTKVATAPTGSIEIDSKNASSTPHNIALEGSGVNEKGKIVQNGGVSTITADLKPGSYTYYCSVPGHREGGMEGKLTVK